MTFLLVSFRAYINYAWIFIMRFSYIHIMYFCCIHLLTLLGLLPIHTNPHTIFMSSFPLTLAPPHPPHTLSFFFLMTQ